MEHIDQFFSVFNYAPARSRDNATNARSENQPTLLSSTQNSSAASDPSDPSPSSALVIAPTQSSHVASVSSPQKTLLPFGVKTSEVSFPTTDTSPSQQDVHTSRTSVGAVSVDDDSAALHTIEPRRQVYDLQLNPYWHKETSFKNEVRLLGKSQWRNTVIECASTYVNMELAAWMVLHLLGVSLVDST